jgi:hypothetical protein
MKMRTKLLLSAAVAAAMSFGAMADVTPIEKPTDFKDAPPEFNHEAVPHEDADVKPLADRALLFGSGEVGQTGLIQQDGDANTADVDQTESGNGLAHIRQDSTGVLEGEAGNTAGIVQVDSAAPSKFDVTAAANVAIIGQTGSENTANIGQLGGFNSTVEVHQEGTGNVYGGAGLNNQVL